jgi:hypothetical protein
MAAIPIWIPGSRLTASGCRSIAYGGLNMICAPVGGNRA